MLGALGGMSVVAMILMRGGFRASVFGLWLVSALLMWVHSNSSALCGAIGW